MTAALSTKTVTPSVVPLRPGIVPKSADALRADYDACVAGYLFAVLNGAGVEHLRRRAEALFTSRNAMRLRGING